MTEAVSSRLIAALKNDGIPAFPEYPQIKKPMPPVPFFVTAACTDIDCGMPVNSSFGNAHLAALTFRIRFHCRTDCDPAEYQNKAENCILHALHDANYDLRSFRRGDLQYNRQLDRLICEMKICIGGTLYLNRGDSA